MLNSPESNVKFTDDQSKQLEMFRGQLQNLQAEITIAQKNITSLKEENVRAVVEKKSLEPQIEMLKKELGGLESEKSLLIASVKDSNEKLMEHHASHVEISKIHQTKQEELTTRESSIKRVELMQEEKQKELFAKNAALLEDRLAVEKAQEAFAEASKCVVWSR